MTPYDTSMEALLHPDPTSTRFVKGNSYTDDQMGAECARLAYVRFENDPSLATRLGTLLSQGTFTEVTHFGAPSVSTFGFGAFSPELGISIVAFRGTQPENWENWRTNLSAWLESWSAGGHVHRGFASAAMAIDDQVRNWLSLARLNSERIIFAGHSLGGAVATLLATLHKPDCVVTIGTPRIGDARFAAALSGVKVRRYQNCADIVPNVPLPPFYQHVAVAQYIDRSGNILGPTQAEAVRLDQWNARREYQPQAGSVPIRDLADHSPINYLRAIIP